jgi:hypothetical protein
MARLEGDQAFPVAIHGLHVRVMTLRDYFAAKAMHAEIVTSCSDATPEAARALHDAAAEAGQTVAERIAFNAYRIADAMLAEREK